MQLLSILPLISSQNQNKKWWDYHEYKRRNEKKQKENNKEDKQYQKMLKNQKIITKDLEYKNLYNK